MKYKFIKEDVLKSGKYDYIVIVEKPYEYLSMIFEGRETSSDIESQIQGIQSVKNGGNPDAYYVIENQTGFIGAAFAPDPIENEYPEGGFQVFDFFTIDKKGNTKLMFTITLEEILKLLKDFKEFLEKNNR